MLHWTIWGWNPEACEASLRRYGRKLVLSHCLAVVFPSLFKSNIRTSLHVLCCLFTCTLCSSCKEKCPQLFQCPIPWSARSPDLNPLDYFLWGNLKSLVFETPVETNMELVGRIVAACNVIQDTPGIFVRVQQNLVRRYHVLAMMWPSIWATVVRCKMGR